MLFRSLACAYNLALEGHQVTVFEALSEPGGMLRYAIPQYRLPKEELKKEIDYIEKLGVEIRCKIEIGKDITLEHIKENSDAIFIGTGAPRGLPLGVDGEDLQGVIDGIRFLNAVNSGEKIEPGKNVAVIGGGNTAVDCARTLKRLGSETVKLIYRRTRDEMPAAVEEVDALLHEGIEIQFLTTPVRFYGENGHLTHMECVRIELGEPDSSGRRRPVPIKDSEFSMPVDVVVKALGQSAHTYFAEGIGLNLTKNGTIEVDPLTKSTNIEGVFAGGDVTTGPAYVVDAIAAGYRAAKSINCFLKGETFNGEDHRKKPEKLADSDVVELSMRFPRSERIKMTEIPAGERIMNFNEVALGYSPAEARAEASRCLAGSIEGCIQCGECERLCEVKAIDHHMQDEYLTELYDGIVLAPGFDLYDPTEKREYGYGVLDGVITGIEFERICSVTGPTGGDILFNGKVPKRFYFIQCVGSRDRQSNARFCSRVCCMYTAKHASIVRDRIGDAEIYISYIDVRAYGKGYEEFYKNTQENGAIYVRGIPGEITKTKNGLLVRVEDILSGEMLEIEVDVVVLATGVRPSKGIEELSRIMSLERDQYGFIKVDSINPSRTNVDGIFVCGMASGPKDIPDTVASGGEAAARCMEYIMAGDERIEAGGSI